MIRNIGLLIMIFSFSALYIASLKNEPYNEKDIKIALFFLLCLAVGLAMILI